MVRIAACLLLGLSPLLAACAAAERCELEPIPCLRAPCPEACAPESVGLDEVCYRFVESDPDAGVHRPCDEGLQCVDPTNAIGFDALRVCKPLDFVAPPRP